ncbi:MAG TPA: TIGR04255 family protein [Bryobacteraceae bacterium]|nr:TIGR04255 family protein [Bryobacteraceae bacterium]
MTDKERAHRGIMASGGKLVPKKLKNDAIVEAILEVRFDTTTIPEILFGRLADYEPWKELSQRRLPAYDIPATLRQVDPNLRFQAVFELSGEQRAVRIGPQVVSYHRTVPYIGWERFWPELQQTITGLFETANGLIIHRLGLRYLNALRSDLHGIASISDLDLEIKVASEWVTGYVNLNFTIDVASNAACMVRIATTEFVQGKLPPNTSVYVDVDVFTKDGFETRERETVESWVTAAHDSEKEQFFRLLTDRSIEALKER